MKNQKKTLCVFCGASFGTDPLYAEAADLLGHYLGESGIRLVYGGGRVGLMGRLAEAVLANGGEVVGVIPQRLYEMIDEYETTGNESLEIVPDMHARKARMYELSDAFLAMPGGIGTCEEFFEAFTWQQLGYHGKPVGLLNINGFYDGLVGFLDGMTGQGFLRREHRESLIVSGDAGEMVERLLL